MSGGPSQGATVTVSAILAVRSIALKRNSEGIHVRWGCCTMELALLFFFMIVFADLHIGE